MTQIKKGPDFNRAQIIMKRITSKIIAVFLSLFFAISAAPVGATVSAREFGDLNSDGKLSLLDLIAMRKYLAKRNVEVDPRAADTNQDGKINLPDLIIIRKALVGLIENPIITEKVPSDYPTEVNDTQVFINQIGYAPDVEKIAYILTDDYKAVYPCFLVNADTQEAVYNADSTTALNDNISQKMAAAFDFSHIKSEGKYYIATPLGRSYTFEIKKNPYAKVNDALTTALYYNRCGCALDADIVGEHYAHGVCHNDANRPVHILNVLNGSGEYTYVPEKDSTADKFFGGLHDAGDYGRYASPANSMISDLLFTAEMFPKGSAVNVITDNVNENISDVLDEARYEMEWMLRMQNRETGGVYFRIATQYFAGWGDHPDNDQAYFSGGLYLSRESIMPTAGLAANAAYCYTLFKNIDPDFANQCLSAAKSAYAYVEENKNDQSLIIPDINITEAIPRGCGAYGFSNADLLSERFYAAAAMYRATGEQQYDNDYKTLFDQSVSKTSAINPRNGCAAYLLNDKADKTYQQKALELLDSTVSSSINVSVRDKFNNIISAGQYGWGSNGRIGNVALKMAFYDHLSGTHKYEKYIRRSLNFILGANPSGYSFITEYGSKTPQNPHHRPNIINRKRYNEGIPGWVVGGISGHAYEDVNNNYKTNEVTIYWNSPLIGAMAYIVERDNV